MLHRVASANGDGITPYSVAVGEEVACGGPAPGVAGDWVTIRQAEASGALRRARSACQFVKRLVRAGAKEYKAASPRHGRAA